MSIEIGEVGLPAVPVGRPETPRSEMDAIIDRLRAALPTWLTTGIDERIHLLESVMLGVERESEEWVRAARVAKGLQVGGHAQGEDYGTGPMLTVRNARLLRNTLIDIRDHGEPQLPGKMWVRPDGRTVVRVYPTDVWDRFILTGVSAELLMQPDISPADVRRNMARVYRSNPGSGGVALVLGAGNVSSIGPMDLLNKLFAENRVCVLKMNPINDYVGPYLERALAALIERDLVAIVYGGPDVGAHLAAHDGIDAIHMTGSDRTYDSIVFGNGEEGRRNKAAGHRINPKPISAELGSVSPMIAVPGPWTDSDIAHQARHIAAAKSNNAGFNCIAAQVVVTAGGWRRRDTFLDAVRGALAAIPERYAYYPGSRARWEHFVKVYPHAEVLGIDTGVNVPWTFIPSIDPSGENEPAFTTEVFNGVLVETALEATHPIEFLSRAVEFCNERLWGSLNATILIHPKTLRLPGVKAALEDALTRLRYGVVGVNLWTGLSYAQVSPPWGPYPGHTPEDIQSGTGVVHNTFMIEHIEKTIVRAPWRPPLKPTWFSDSRTGHEVFRRLIALEASPSLRRLVPIAWKALRS